MFKVGAIVVKARRFSTAKYCEHGGDEKAVPIGSKGTITSIMGNQASVTFTKGYGWLVNTFELDLEKIENWKEKMEE